MGVDPGAFTFAWQLVSDRRRIRQQCCQVSLLPLREDGSTDLELWNSGIYRTTMPFLFYDGPVLQPHQRYRWKLRVWVDGYPDPVESEANFVTGLSPADWTADWIWNGEPVSPNQFAYFRKEYVLEQSVLYAYLSISTHHHFQLLINGKRVGGYVSPAPSDPSHGKLYVTYDITPLLHPDGLNCLAVIALYLGGGGQYAVDGLPGLIIQADLVMQDGERRRWATGTDWEHYESGTHRSGTPFQQNQRITPIEDVDARKLHTSWTRYGYSNNRYRRAELSPAAEAGWRLTPQRIPEGDIEDLFLPELESSEHTSDGCRLIYDAGRIVSGWVRLRLPGIRNTAVRVRYSEQLAADGGVERKVCNETSEHYYDQYTMRGDDIEEWEPAMTHKAFRYIEVTGYPVPLQVGQMVAAVRTGLLEVGLFHSSDPYLNTLHEACVRTQKNNILGQVVDCPHREQAQYLADSDLQAELLLYHFGTSAAMLEKTLIDFAAAQKPDGAFPFVAPSNDEHPDFAIRIPEWDLHFVSLLWKVYEATGDISIIRRHYDAAKRSVSYWLSMCDQEGLLHKSAWWHISDWPYPTVDESGDVLTVQNTKLCRALRLLAKMAAIAGLDGDIESWTAMSIRSARTIANSLFDSESNGFMDSLGSPSQHQGVNALALLEGLAPRTADASAILKRIAEQAWEARAVLSLPLLRLLFDHGYADKAYALLRKTDFPGWGYMIAQGSPTMWEGWDDIESHSHAWNGYPARLLYEYVAGIQIAAPGFSTIRFQPYCPEDLAFAEASIPTPFGVTRIRWERQAPIDGIEVALEVPAGALAELQLTSHMRSKPLDEVQVYERISGNLVWKDNALSTAIEDLFEGERLHDEVTIRSDSVRAVTALL
ncbi:alpha-L-rhamnosidase [Paenibacillus guangzhouensis]|uniref:alpha-L-rhamnosidase n=1 Tax=Paenibacillus guangzhouensis TaxID=1473112 RepID=UPI001266B158|nr:alpha-L-rhamnosidase [Paenibacillus guangzhouensis]